MGVSKDRDARDKLIAGIACAVVVTAIAVGCYGYGSRWSEVVRGFCAGIAVAAMFANIAGYRWRRAAARREALLDAETERVARAFADAVERELSRRGIEREMRDTETKPRVH